MDSDQEGFTESERLDLTGQRALMLFGIRQARGGKVAIRNECSARIGSIRIKAQVED